MIFASRLGLIACVLIALACVVGGGVASGQTSKIAKPVLPKVEAPVTVPMAAPIVQPIAAPLVLSPADQAVEQEPLRITERDIKAVTARTSTTAPVSNSAGDLSRIGFALLAVIGVILILRTVIRHMTAMPGAGRGSKLVTVLSRSVLSPRQSVLVLQVGKRLLVVGDSAGRMSSLCEISDPDEIAMMVGQNRPSSAGNEKNPASFMNVFRRATMPFEETNPEPDALRTSEPKVEQEESVSTDEMKGLLDKVKMLQRQFNLNKT